MRERNTVAASGLPSRRPGRRRVYQILWVAGAVMTIAWGLVIWGNWTEAKRSVMTSPTSMHSYVDQRPMSRGIPGATTTVCVTEYTFQAGGVSCLGAQQRSVPDDYAVPAFVCYDPNDPATSALGFPGQVGCSSQGGSGPLYDASDPLYWIIQVCIFGALFGGTALAFSKWRRWRTVG